MVATDYFNWDSARLVELSCSVCQHYTQETQGQVAVTGELSLRALSRRYKLSHMCLMHASRLRSYLQSQDKLKVFSHFPSTSQSHMYRCLISTPKFCLLFALLNYEMSSYSFQVSSKFCTNPIFTLKSKDNLNLKSQSFSPYEYTQKDIFSSMS